MNRSTVVVANDRREVGNLVVYDRDGGGDWAARDHIVGVFVLASRVRVTSSFMASSVLVCQKMVKLREF